MTKKEIEEELGINRNIVECKSELGRRFPATGAVLIETLWNVNVYRRFPWRS